MNEIDELMDALVHDMRQAQGDTGAQTVTLHSEFWRELGIILQSGSDEALDAWIADKVARGILPVTSWRS